MPTEGTRKKASKSFKVKNEKRRRAGPQVWVLSLRPPSASTWIGTARSSAKFPRPGLPSDAGGIAIATARSRFRRRRLAQQANANARTSVGLHLFNAASTRPGPRRGRADNNSHDALLSACVGLKTVQMFPPRNEGLRRFEDGGEEPEAGGAAGQMLTSGGADPGPAGGHWSGISCWFPVWRLSNEL